MNVAVVNIVIGKCYLSATSINTQLKVRMHSSLPGLSGVHPDISSSGFQDDLWSPGQEWIMIFDNLLKHPQGIKRGCSCDICSLARYPIMPACPLSTRLSLPTNSYKTGRRRSGGIEKVDEICAGESKTFCDSKQLYLVCNHNHFL